MADVRVFRPTSLPLFEATADYALRGKAPAAVSGEDEIDVVEDPESEDDEESPDGDVEEMSHLRVLASQMGLTAQPNRPITNYTPQELAIIERLENMRLSKETSVFDIDAPGTRNEMQRPIHPEAIMAHSAKAGKTNFIAVPQTSMSSNSAPFAQEVFIDEGEMDNLDKILRNNPIARMAVDLLTEHVIGGGIQVTMEFFGSKIQLDPEIRELFAMEWSNRFLRGLVKSWLYYGFVVPRLVESKVVIGELVPVVIERCTYDSSMVISFEGQREYRVYPKQWHVSRSHAIGKPIDSGAGLGKERDASSGDSSSKKKDSRKPVDWKGDESVTLYTYPGSEPHPDGTLNSPLSTLIPLLVRNEWADEDNVVAGYWGARPIPSMNASSTTAADLVDPLEHIKGPDDKTAAYKKEKTKEASDVSSDLARASINNLARQVRNVAIADAIASRKAGSDYPANPAAVQPPIRVAFIPPPGFALSPSVAPQFNPHAIEMRRYLFAIVANVCRIPNQMLSTDQAMHAANAEFNLSMLQLAVSTFQAQIRPVLIDLFKMAYRTKSQEFRRAATVGLAGLADEGPDPTPAQQLAGETHLSDALRKHFKSTGEPNQSGPIAGEPDSTKPRDYTPTYAKKLDAAALRQLVDQNVRFAITFQRTPLTTYAVIKTAYDDNFISFDSASKLIGQILHLPPELMLTEAAHWAQAKKRAAADAEAQGMVAEATNVGGEGGAKGGAKKKPGKSSSGSSSSSKKRSSESSGSSGSSTKKTTTEKKTSPTSSSLEKPSSSQVKTRSSTASSSKKSPK